MDDYFLALTIIFYILPGSITALGFILRYYHDYRNYEPITFGHIFLFLFSVFIPVINISMAFVMIEGLCLSDITIFQRKR